MNVCRPAGDGHTLEEEARLLITIPMVAQCVRQHAKYQKVGEWRVPG
jgi:hypothetical protein